MKRNKAVNKKEQERLTQVELDTKTISTDVRLIQKDISVIKTNHLKHIEDDVKKIDMRLWAILLLLVASLFIPFIKSLWSI
tara:strand:- start:598 stop:840 length:243 start_codon:yes stop_codon:yes gene_type:complete